MSGDAISVKYTLTPNLAGVALRAATPRITSGTHGPMWWATFILVGIAVGAAVIEGLRWSLGFEVEGSHILSFLLGTYVMIGVWNWRFRRDVNLIVQQRMASQETAGETTARFSGAGLSFSSGHGESNLNWIAATEILSVPEGTVLCFGGTSMAIPNAALPETLSPEEFLQQLRMWWKAR